MTQSQTDRPTRTGLSISPNALLLFGGFMALGWALAALTNPPGIVVFLFVAVGWIVSVVVHEFGHAFVAWRAGDTSVAEKGYLTLDPFKYSDVGVTIVLPLIALLLGGIGFPGAAVYIRQDLIRSRLGRSLTSLAGPAGTLIVLLALAALLSRLWTGEVTPLVGAVAVLAFLQATALILNLLPVPGLDGYGVIRPFLPASMQTGLRKWEGGAFFILFLLIFLVPGVSDFLFGGALEICRALGIPVQAIARGWGAFQFWR
ncbi:MAG: site-2 protease family protein [Ignavibacteriales bacterium]